MGTPARSSFPGRPRRRPQPPGNRLEENPPLTTVAAHLGASPTAAGGAPDIPPTKLEALCARSAKKSRRRHFSSKSLARPRRRCPRGLAGGAVERPGAWHKRGVSGGACERGRGAGAQLKRGFGVARAPSPDARCGHPWPPLTRCRLRSAIHGSACRQRRLPEHGRPLASELMVGDGMENRVFRESLVRLYLLRGGCG